MLNLHTPDQRSVSNEHKVGKVDHNSFFSFMNNTTAERIKTDVIL